MEATIDWEWGLKIATSSLFVGTVAIGLWWTIGLAVAEAARAPSGPIGRMPTATTHAKHLLVVKSSGADEKDGETVPLRHKFAEDGLVSTYDPEITTLYDNFIRAVGLYSNAHA